MFSLIIDCQSSGGGGEGQFSPFIYFRSHSARHNASPHLYLIIPFVSFRSTLFHIISLYSTPLPLCVVPTATFAPVAHLRPSGSSGRLHCTGIGGAIATYQPITGSIGNQSANQRPQLRTSSRRQPITGRILLLGQSEESVGVRKGEKTRQALCMMCWFPGCVFPPQIRDFEGYSAIFVDWT